MEGVMDEPVVASDTADCAKLRHFFAAGLSAAVGLAMEQHVARCQNCWAEVREHVFKSGAQVIEAVIRTVFNLGKMELDSRTILALASFLPSFLLEVDEEMRLRVIKVLRNMGGLFDLTKGDKQDKAMPLSGRLPRAKP
ncbi:hypothetical protein HY224_02115 [Candidatus Uhrbacteria bacterium]|nr:hypothetical protein [Candidatus Uhrbacteria bacterium]